jgi:hypothetical protein
MRTKLFILTVAAALCGSLLFSQQKLKKCDAIEGVRPNPPTSPLKSVKCSQEEVINDIANQLIDRCEAHRKAANVDACSTGTGCKEKEKEKCIEFISDFDKLSIRPSGPSRDPNCPSKVHWSVTFNGTATCKCHCEELVPPPAKR